MKITVIFFIVCLAVSFFLSLKQIKKYQKFYDTVNSMLDDIIYGRMVKEPGLNEEKESVIANKILRIEDKLNLEVGQAVEEREKIKRLISDMSHQLKTPLANVMMYGDIIQKGGLTEEKRQKFQIKLMDQTGKIAWVLNSLFKMIQLEEGVLEFEVYEHDIQDTVLRAISSIYEKAKMKNISIQVLNLEENTVTHNEKWTAEVIENLLENAIKYSEYSQTIELDVVRQAVYTQIKVIDHGIGISKEEQMEIFKRFYRSKDVEKQEGTGIGLYLSRMIIEKEHGYITVESEKGKGSTFSVFLLNGKN